MAGLCHQGCKPAVDRTSAVHRWTLESLIFLVSVDSSVIQTAIVRTTHTVRKMASAERTQAVSRMRTAMPKATYILIFSASVEASVISMVQPMVVSAGGNVMIAATGRLRPVKTTQVAEPC